MKRHSRKYFCLVALLIGIAVGFSLGLWPLNAIDKVNARTRNEASDLYGELDADNSALVESGHVLAKIADLTTPSVVHIQSERTVERLGRRVRSEETGSGVIMRTTRSGAFVITNRHVVNGADLEKISIYLHDARVIHPVAYWDDKASDVAVLKVSVSGLQPGRWGDSDTVKIGHIVLAMGSPFGLSQSVTFGIISAKGRRSLRLGGADVINQDFLQTDAAINPGNSGGPLIDLRGRVIGINTAIASNSGGNEGIGFSIPSNLVRRVVDQLLQHGMVQRAYLGVVLDSDFQADEAARLTLDRIRGARVTQIYPNTPAAQAKLQQDDVILTFDGIEVQDENHLINIVSLSPVGKRVTIVVLRNGKKLMFEVTLDNRPIDEEQSEAPTAPGMGYPVETMGLTLHELDQELAVQLDLDKSSKGLLVLKVELASPLSRDVKLYDLIEEVACKPVSSIKDLRRVLDANGSSNSVLMKVKRTLDGQVQRQLVVWRLQHPNGEALDR